MSRRAYLWLIFRKIFPAQLGNQKMSRRHVPRLIYTAHKPALRNNYRKR